jgi:hypothetical protein
MENPMEEQQTPLPEAVLKPKRAYKQRDKLSDAEKAIDRLDKTHKFVRLDILKALRARECSPGTNSRLAYLKALQQLEIDYVQQITSMGFLPKNVKAQTTTNYVFKAHVAKSGNVTTVAVSSPSQLRELERIELTEMKTGHFSSDEDDAIRAQLDAEFGDRAAQPEVNSTP